MILNKNHFKLIAVIVLTLGLSISLQSIFASWTSPTVAPPGDNVSAPLDESNFPQMKGGSLGVNMSGSNEIGLIVEGKVGVGTNTPESELSVEGNISATENINADGYYNGEGKGLFWCKGNCPQPTEN